MKSASHDLPERLLARAVRAMRAERREWGDAMLSELAQIHDTRERWRFALECARAALLAPRGEQRVAPVHIKDPAMSDKPAMDVLQKWGGLASCVMAAALVSSSLIYLSGDLRAAGGPLTYATADFLSGPVWAACLVIMVCAMRERIGASAPRTMNMALLFALFAAGAFVAVACIRSANRHYHLAHPELGLENSSTVLAVWATLVAGVGATGWHFLGWSLVTTASAGWMSRLLPGALSTLLFIAGALAMFVYAIPDLEGFAALLMLAGNLWQGWLLWTSGRRALQSS